MTEAQWQQQVLDLARLGGWRIAHFGAARTEKGWRTPVREDGAGWPDLVLIRPPQLIFAELKAEKGKTTPEQDAWLEDLVTVAAAAAGLARAIESAYPMGSAIRDPLQVYVWRPSNFDEVRCTLLERS